MHIHEVLLFGGLSVDSPFHFREMQCMCYVTWMVMASACEWAVSIP